MISSKMYKYRLDGRGECGIKEEKRRIKRRGQYSRVTISVGLNSDLEIVPRVRMLKSIFTDTREMRADEGLQGIYYKLSEITYIATIRYEVRADGKEDVRVTMIHVPEMIVSEDELQCRMVTQDFSEEYKERIIENVIDYVRSEQ